MANVKLINVNKKYPNGYHAVKNVNLEIANKEFMVLVGPSGCGKTTTLRMIAGLEEITEGEIFIGDKMVNDVSPKDRDIAMVFQNYALYPHMSVYDNMAFGLKLSKTPKKEINDRINWASEILGITELLKRKPKQLSGGQRQRVALGRAIVRKPQVFLMDEPLSNLDAKLRVQMRTELIKLHKDLETTFIYVTHDQTEAMTMGTRICVMNNGEIQQVDDPRVIYNSPANLFVAGFIGAPQMNFFNGKVVEGKVLDVYGLKLELPERLKQAVKNKNKENSEVIVGVRPEDVFISEGEDGLKTVVEFTELLGSDLNIYFKIDGKQYVLRTQHTSNLKMDDEVKVIFDKEKIHLFDIETEKSLTY
ncbi:sn-glycerol-3-phosphate ABC transporter ATP-binding protein UgpC [Soehngenia longivitae]|uniref:sn-glycerol-3-phosphate ABC transporter ATP-binding protein UgpC n=1 Tax=Soehngenia longivitae TaxID=2562294 RepID=A0A4Z0D789_9FIRM|nr:sn-glycerol-3-phosphate ABC transporter ATP-binding protein UgpC [Soehngenia longivitae]TFZ40758.1 sn-glycerol-3-phosphate ABC transporter ATP-binding protein UgpC [Soehngenia longivitae]